MDRNELLGLEYGEKMLVLKKDLFSLVLLASMGPCCFDKICTSRTNARDFSRIIGMNEKGSMAGLLLRTDMLISITWSWTIC